MDRRFFLGKPLVVCSENTVLKPEQSSASVRTETPFSGLTGMCAAGRERVWGGPRSSVFPEQAIKLLSGEIESPDHLF